jgi:hypothetical protein
MVVINRAWPSLASALPGRGAILPDISLVTQECVDHHDTDTPHTHIIARGLRANAHDLVPPRDFIKHSIHSLA